MPANEEIKENNIESLEPKKALKKKVLIKSKDKVKDLDLSNYGYRTQARIYAIMSLYAYEMNKGDMNLEEVLSFDYEDKNINDSIKQTMLYCSYNLCRYPTPVTRGRGISYC